VLQGAPVHTIDLHIVYALTESNIVRLEFGLSELGAIFRDDPRRIAPDRSHLQSRGHKLLQTSASAIDCREGATRPNERPGHARASSCAPGGTPEASPVAARPPPPVHEKPTNVGYVSTTAVAEEFGTAPSRRFLNRDEVTHAQL